MLRAVLYRPVYQRALLQRPIARVWQHMLSVWLHLPQRPLLSIHASVSAAVLFSGQRVHRQSVRATWQHTMWQLLLRVRCGRVWLFVHVWHTIDSTR